LKYLDLSSNNLLGHDLALILEALSQEGGLCKIRNLNLSGNNAEPQAEPVGFRLTPIVDKFSDRLQKLLKSSLSIQHLDISCLRLDEK